MGSRPPGLLFLISLLHIWHCVRGEPSYIIDTLGLTIQPSNTVQRGTPVEIRCQVSVSYSNITHLTHLFQLTRNDVPIYSCNTTNDTVVYNLNSARAADSGSYECHVRVKDKNKISNSKELDVRGLQTPTLHLNNPTPYENEEFMATCSAPEEKGSLTFRFYQRFRTEEPEIIKQMANRGNSSTATLRLRHNGECFLYCDYKVNLVYQNQQSNRSKETRVVVRALYISPIMNVLPSNNVFEGDIIEVICKIVNPPNNTELFLTKNKIILKVAKAALSHQITVQEGDSGELTCKAVWGSVQKESYETITVKELFSKPHLTVEPTDIFEGDKFKLKCSVSIYVPERIDSKAMQYSIYKDNVIVRSANTYSTVAARDKNGNYTCKAYSTSLTYNFVKESQVKFVKAKVPVSGPILTVAGGTLLLGEPFQLFCHSNNGTLPITYTLFGPRKFNETRVVSKPGEKAIFNFPAIFQHSDLNKLLCHAKNDRQRAPMIVTGTQLLHSTNIIVPVSKPGLTVLPGIEDIYEGRNMTLLCSVQQGSPPINFTWHRTDTKGVLYSQLFNELTGSYNISNVNGKHGGGYYCMSTNLARETKRSLTVIIGVKMAGWKKGLIAVFCILFILAMIFLFVFKTGFHKLNKRRTGNLSVKSAGTKVERLSLTQAEVIVSNATPGMMGKSIWSEHASGTESDDNSSVITSEKPEPQYTEVQLRQPDPNRVLVKQGTDTVYSEVRNSQQGVQELNNGVSVEYAELNHDIDRHSDPSNHGDQSVNDSHTNETDNSISVNTADNGE